MLVTRAYRYELDPNDRTKTQLAKHAGAARFAWNWALARRVALYANETGDARFSDSFKDHREWNQWKRTNAPWASEISTCPPHEAFRDLDSAFRRLRSSRSVGFPRFKKKGQRDAFRLTGRIHVKERHIRLPNLGWIRSKERTAVAGRILSATVSRLADRWFVSLTVEEERTDVAPRTGDPVGLDLGITSFAVLSDGTSFSAPKPLAKSLGKLKTLCRRLNRKKKGSRNREKAVLKFAKLHSRVRNQRRDFLQKLSTSLVKTKPAIVVESLQVSNLVRNRRLSRAISDAGWAEFLRMLKYKAAWYGSKIVVAGKFFPSSRLCSSCGFRLEELALNAREWKCPECSTVHDRDKNAAMNLQKLGTASWAGTAGEAPGTPVDDTVGGGTAKAGLRVAGRRSRKRTPAPTEAE